MAAVGANMIGGNGGAGATSSSGYFLPEESAAHERTFMQWPVNRTVHPDPVFLKMLQRSIAAIANAISEFEPVVMLMGERHRKAAGKLLSASVDIWNIATDDLWCRDSGPVFVVDGKGGLAVADLNFNGWGGKQVHDNDGKIARSVAGRLGLPVFDSRVVGEAGGVETDGEGTLIAHESSWANPNRNMGSRDEIEAKLLHALGGRKMIWAPGVAGADITDYHIDSLARFVAPGKVIIQLPETVDPDDPWSKAAFRTYDILKGSTDANGRTFDIVTLPEPYDTRIISPSFVASYVNYYVCNGAVIMAGFGDRDTDRQAEQTIASLYPDRRVVSLNVDPVGETGGGIHCATREQPKI